MTIYQYQLFSNRPKIVQRARKPRALVGRFISLGAGVQSSTLVEMVVEGELPPVDAVIFADTGDEPPWVYEQVWHLAERLQTVDTPLIVVMQSPGGLIKDAQSPGSRFVTMPLWTQNPKTGKIGKLRRQCTADYKILPVESWIRDWLMARGHGKLITDKLGRTYRRISTKVCTEHLYGISLDEWERMDHSGPGWVRAVYPFVVGEHQMTREGCLAWLKAHNCRIPRKSSCKKCPFHDNNYWSFIKENEPEIWEEDCQFDDWLRTPDAKTKLTRGYDQPVYLHHSCIPLRSIDFKAAPQQELPMCGNHCRL